MSAQNTTMSPPYRHLPTSITTSHSIDPAATTSTALMPPIGAHDDTHHRKDAYGWFDEIEGTYVSEFDALLLDGWTITARPTTGDICISTVWLTPPTTLAEPATPPTTRPTNPAGACDAAM